MAKTQTSSAEEGASPDTAPSEPSAETTEPLTINGAELAVALEQLESFSLVRVALAALSILHNRVVNDPNNNKVSEEE